jgi:hypothetical protein
MRDLSAACSLRHRQPCEVAFSAPEKNGATQERQRDDDNPHISLPAGTGNLPVRATGGREGRGPSNSHLRQPYAPNGMLAERVLPIASPPSEST